MLNFCEREHPAYISQYTIKFKTGTLDKNPRFLNLKNFSDNLLFDNEIYNKFYALSGFNTGTLPIIGALAKY